MKRASKKAVKKLAPSVVKQLHRVIRMESSLNQLNAKIDELTVSINNHDSRLDVLKKLASGVEPYQPIYGVSGIVNAPKRNSEDRCKAIIESFDNNMAKYSILDIGSSLGYVSFFLADQGANVEGWEVSSENMAVAVAAQAVNGIPVRFLNKGLDLESAKAIPNGKFDIAIILSVFHHVIYDEGLEVAQQIVKELTKKVPILIVELARKGEDSNLWWDAAQPENELDIFKGLNVDIEIIGESSTHLSSSSRKLYKVTRKNIEINRKIYPIKKVSRLAYSKSQVPLSGLKREYITSNKDFIKHYHFSKDAYDNTDQIINEINLFNSLKRLGKTHPLMVKMKDFEINPEGALIVFEKIEGKLAGDAGELVKIVGYNKILRDLIGTLSFLESVGYYHNDIRSWNIMISKKHAWLIDYGLAATRPMSNNPYDLMWAMHGVITGKRESSTQYKKKELPPIMELGRSRDLRQVYDLIEEGETSFIALDNALNKSKNKRSAKG